MSLHEVRQIDIRDLEDLGVITGVISMNIGGIRVNMRVNLYDSIYAVDRPILPVHVKTSKRQ